MKLLFVYFSLFISCAAKPPQHLPKFGIQHCWFFSKQEFAGIIQVDENGKPKTKGSWMSYFIYIETQGNKIPTWEQFVYDGKKYEINILPVNDSVVNVGKVQDSENDIIINPAKGNKLWKLQIPNLQIKTATKNFLLVLTGKLQKQKVQLSIQQKINQLEPDLRP
jgi:hypothetical protein